MTNAANGETLNVFNPETAEYFEGIFFESGCRTIRICRATVGGIAAGAPTAYRLDG